MLILNTYIQRYKYIGLMIPTPPSGLHVNAISFKEEIRNDACIESDSARIIQEKSKPRFLPYRFMGIWDIPPSTSDHQERHTLRCE